MMRIRSLVAALTLVTIVGTNASAQAKHPDFSGVWTLDPSKAVAEGALGAPTSATYTIRQHGDTIVSDRVAEAPEVGTIKSHVVWGTDGKPWKNTIPVNGEDTQISSTLSWNADTLVIRTTLTVQETAVDQLDQWSVSADGKLLTMRRSISAMGQDLGTSTLVFKKS